jgi:hypothetical protein
MGMKVASWLQAVFGNFEEDAFRVVEAAETFTAGVSDPKRDRDRRRNESDAGCAEALAVVRP